MTTHEGLKKIELTLPAYVAQRKRNWKHFGSVTPENCFDATSIGEEVFMEFTRGQGRSPQDYYREQSRYVDRAYKCGFSYNTLKQIEESDTPKATFETFFKQQLHGTFMRVLSDYYQQNATENEGTPLQAKAPVGLKARMKMRQSKAEEVLSTGDDGAVGLRARLSARKDAKGAEHERSLFVSNIPVEYTEQDIKEELFVIFGEDLVIERINVVRKPNAKGVKESIGKAFLVCDSSDDAEAMLDALNDGIRWGACIIDVQRTEPR